jgi:ATP-binding cassette, subfamily B, multidrug efflux pump
MLRLSAYIRPYSLKLGIGFLTMLVATVLTMGSPYLVKWAIDTGLNPTDSGFDGSKATLLLVGGGLIAFAIGRGLAQFGQTYISMSVGELVAYDIRNDIYANMQRLSYAYHDKVQTGQIMSRATQDVENIKQFIGLAALRAFYIFGMIAIGMGIMLFVNWQLALISFVTLPVIGWRSFVIHTQMRPLWLEIQASQARLTEVAEEGLSGIRVVKAFSREPVESAKFEKAAAWTRDLQLEQSQTMAKHMPLMQGLAALQLAITVGAGAYMVANGNLSEGSFFLFALSINLLVLPIRMLGFIVTMFARAISACERVFELLDAQSEVQEKPGAKPLIGGEGHVRFEDVSFGYDQVSPVLQDLDIDGRPGKVIALLGPTGSGKSTVVNLIPRFYDVTKGRITIDGTDIRDFELESLRESIGIVQQDIFLFVGTIRDNIAYGVPDASQEDIERVAKAARIHDFIVSLPFQYDEWVGERGVTLSGGQKQRIAIARTLLRDPKVLIFDDSTASVDTQTEFLIQQALANLMEGRTTFVIAQRLRTVMRADEIIVLEAGKIVQRGKHAELLEEEEGLYRHIYDLELKDQEDALGQDAAQRSQEFVPTSAAGGGN